MNNAPSFADFIAECVGHRDWYTRARPCPVRARNREYIAPRKFASIKAAYYAMFGGEVLA